MRNFELSEFDSPDLRGSGSLMNVDFLNLLDRARDVANIPFKINSGVRTLEHNMSIGGKIDSSHLKGIAVDISATDSRSRFLIMNALISVGLHRIGIGKTFIHVDADTSKSRNVYWVY